MEKIRKLILCAKGKEKMKEPLVSIIVPIYNIQNYLSKCIHSLVKQSYENLEIILVDDGSTDQSSSICRDYAIHDSRIQFITQKNQGVVQARNNGFKCSSGSYIMFVDGDDYIDEHMVESMVKMQQKYQVDIVSCQYYDDNEKGVNKSVIRPTPGYYNREKIIRLIQDIFLYDFRIKMEGVPSFLWGNLFSRHLIPPILEVGNGLAYNEDQVGKLQAFYLAEKIYIMEDALYYYVGHSGQTMRSYNIRFWTDLPLYFERIKCIDSKHYLDKQIPERAFILLKMLLKMEYTRPNNSVWNQYNAVKKHFSPFLYKLAIKAEYEKMTQKEKLQYKLIQHKWLFLYGIFIYINLRR